MEGGLKDLNSQINQPFFHHGFIKSFRDIQSELPERTTFPKPFEIPCFTSWVQATHFVLETKDTLLWTQTKLAKPEAWRKDVLNLPFTCLQACSHLQMFSGWRKLSIPLWLEVRVLRQNYVKETELIFHTSSQVKIVLYIRELSFASFHFNSLGRPRGCEVQNNLFPPFTEETGLNVL